MADEEGRSVVVRLNSSKDLSCSGIVLDFETGIVLTVGSLFKDVLNTKCVEESKTVLYSKPTFSSMNVNQVNQHDEDEEIGVEVLVRTRVLSKDETISFKNTLLSGRLAVLWRNNKLSELVQSIFPAREWKFSEDEGTEPNGNLKYPTTFTDNPEAETTKNAAIDCPSEFLSVFALLHVPDLRNVKTCSPASVCYSDSFDRLLNKLRELSLLQIGDPVKVVGTPFGFECTSVFFNSVSKGIISNLAGANSELMLTDARAVPGCEGCPLYLERLTSASSSALVGMVIAPFCWRNGEWIGITLACAVSQILNSLLIALKKNSEGIPELFINSLEMIPHASACRKTAASIGGKLRPVSQNAPEQNSLINLTSLERSHSLASLSIRGEELSKVLSSVVLVEAERSWGSGIIIDAAEGLVMTCSHVIRRTNEQFVCPSKSNSGTNASNSVSVTPKVKIRTGSSDFAWYDARILFATKPEFPLDFALLKVENKTNAQKLSREMSNQDADSNPYMPNVSKSRIHESFAPTKGEPVIVVGHAMFGGNLALGPSVTLGVLSNVVHVEGHTVMLQTSSAVHCGASGGAVVSAQTGELLGLVTCNTKDASSSASFPHINFAIPVNLLRLLLLQARNSIQGRSFEMLIPPGTEDIWSLKKNQKQAFSSHL